MDNISVDYYLNYIRTIYIFPDASHIGAARDTSRQNVRGGRCLNNCTKGAKNMHFIVQFRPPWLKL